MSRILLADDSPHAQRMGERILREEGYEVVSVTDGNTAIQRMLDVDPDLIIADAFLPGRNGFDLCRYAKLQPAHGHVRVVMTAGLLEAFDEDEARRAGADAIIKKPFEASMVIQTIIPLIRDAQHAKEEARRAAEQPPEPEPFHDTVAELIVPAAESGLDPELLRAAVTVALDAAMPALVDDITARVLSLLKNARK